MKAKKRKWLASLLAVCMVFALMPAIAFAAGETVEVSNGMNFSPTTTQDAIDQWAAGAATITNNGDGSFTVTLLKNITLKQGAVSPITFGDYRDAQGKDQPSMILELNGCTVSGKTTVIANYGNLIIQDTQGTGKVLYDGGGTLCTVQNAGYSLTIKGGTFECIGEGSAVYNAAINTAASTETVIEGGTFNGNDAGALIAYGNVTIKGGTFNGEYGVVSKKTSFDAAGSITFPENSTAVINAGKAALVVHGNGTIDGTITVKGGTFHAPSVAGAFKPADKTKDITISGGNYTADPSSYVADEIAAIKYTNGGTAELYAVGNEVQSAAGTVNAGDTITVLQGNVALTVNHNVTVKNEGTGNNVSVNNVSVPAGGEVTAHTAVKVEAKAPTSVLPGNIEYWHCPDCGKYFRDESLTQEITLDDTILPATGVPAGPDIPVHTHSFSSVWAANATHHYRECACGAIADMAEHNFTQDIMGANNVRERVCGTCGYKEISIIPANPELPQTGDSEIVSLVPALLFLICGAALGLTAYNKRKDTL